MFEVWFEGGGIQRIRSKHIFFLGNWKWTNYTVFSRFRQPLPDSGFKASLKSQTNKTSKKLILVKSSKKHQSSISNPPDEKITSLAVFCIYHSGLVSVISANLNPIVLLSSRGRPSLGYKYHNHFLTFSRSANKFYKSDNNRNSKFFEAGEIIFPTHNNIPIFPLSLCSIDVTPETSVITFNYHHHRIYFD